MQLKGMPFVITPGNYNNYTKNDLHFNNGTVVPLTYEPVDFRPPESWYRKNKISLPIKFLTKDINNQKDHYNDQELIHKAFIKKKQSPGRKKGTGTRKERLNFRCSSHLITVLDAMKYSSWSFKGQSHADIIHAAVKSLALMQFPDSTEDLNKAIDQL